MDSSLANLFAYLDLSLETNLDSGLEEWRQIWGQMRDNWQLGTARQLLQLVKHYPLTSRQQSTLYTLEGQMLAQEGKWSEALRAYEKCLALMPSSVAALSGKGNALRHLEGRATEAVQCLRDALTFADEQDRADVQNNLGLAYYEAGQLDNALEALNEARAKFHERRDQRREASALHNLGSVAWTQGRLNEAEEYFSSAQTLYQNLNERHEIAETLNSLGLVQEAQGRWHDAATTYRQALSLLQTDNDEYGQAQVLANLGNVLTLLGDYPSARQCYENGLLIAQALGDTRLEGQLLTGLGDVLVAQGETAQALTTFQASLQRKQVGGDQRSLKHTWLSLGALYHKLRQPSQAEEIYRQALNAARIQDDRRIETHALINLAKLALVQSRVGEAATWLNEAEPLARKGDFSDALSDSAQLRGDLELLNDAPDYQLILRHYTEALAHAHDFNPIVLQRTLDYLTNLIRAMAADGQPVVIQMASDFARLAKTIELPQMVADTFESLETELESSRNE